MIKIDFSHIGITSKMSISIFTDGSCTNNGNARARAGYGVYIQDHENLNISEPVPGENQTNNRGELMGIEAGLRVYEKEFKGQDCTIYTDSKYFTNALELGWLKSWIKNKWKTSNKQPVKNQDIWMNLLDLMNRNPKVKYKWIPRNSLPGHKQADRLAREGGLTETSVPQTNILYIKTDNLFLIDKYKSRKNTTDSGVDLHAPDQKLISPNELGQGINFEIQCKMVNGDGESIGYRLVPRSSISKTPLRMSNSEGIIDPGYRGSIIAKVDNLSLLTGKPETYVIEQGERLFQIVSPDLGPITVQLVTELDETTRGQGGFGSTGKY